MTKAKQPHAIIIGGSLGGLLAANMLVRRGWRVSVWERTHEPLSARGAGIVAHPSLIRDLAAAGVDVRGERNVTVEGRAVFGADGDIIEQCDLPQILMAWGRLHRLLEDALPVEIQRGANLVDLEQDAGGVTAVFQDGRAVTGDLLVAADGTRSTVRERLALDARPTYAGYVAWRGLVDEGLLSPRTRNDLLDRFAFCLPPREQMLGYPVPGADGAVTAGARRFNFVWYRPAAETTDLHVLLTDIDGRHQPEGVAPGRIAPQVIAQMRASADAVLAPQFAEVVRRTEQPFFQPIFDLAAPRLAIGRIALLGDAAFVARPHCGMGVTKAAADAAALVRALVAFPGVEAGLRAYEQERLPAGNQIVEHARRLGAYMQAQLSPSEQAHAERHRSPRAVMTETAVDTAAQAFSSASA